MLFVLCFIVNNHQAILFIQFWWKFFSSHTILSQFEFVAFNTIKFQMEQREAPNRKWYVYLKGKIDLNQVKMIANHIRAF